MEAIDEDHPLEEAPRNGWPMSRRNDKLQVAKKAGERLNNSVKFSKFPGDMSFGYAVLNGQATGDLLDGPLDFLTEWFHIPKPEVVVSVIGEVSDDPVVQCALTTFQDGLSMALRTTGAWTFTDGIQRPLNNLVGEAHRTRHTDVVPAVGVTQFDKHLLERSESTSVAKRDADRTYLESSHSLFIFFEKRISQRSEQQDLCVKVLRLMMEAAHKDFRPLPAVLLLIGGDPSHLLKVDQAVNAKIPVLVLQGTGGAADVLAKAIDECRTIGESRNSDSEESTDESDSSTATRSTLLAHKIVVFCRNDPNLLRKVDLSNDVLPQSLSIAILKAALKGPKMKTKDQFTSFLSWELDLSSLRVLTSWLLQDIDLETLINQKPKLLDKMLKNALFTRHFLSHILPFLKKTHIEALYGDAKDSLYRDTKLAPYKVMLTDVKDLLRTLYLPLDSITFYFSRQATTSEERVVSLFLWAVLSNRQEVAKVIWEDVPEPLLAALVAFKILREQDKRFDQPKMGFDKHAQMFEGLAVELLDQYHRTNVEQTKAILSKKSLAWGNVSPFRMATHSQDVMSHESFEPVVKEVWRGDLVSPLWKVCLFSFFQLRPLLTYKRTKGFKKKFLTVSPQIKIFQFMFSFVAFLAACTINLLLGKFEQRPALAWLVAFWVITALLEELSQMIRFRGFSPITTPMIGPHLLFLVGFVLRNPVMVHNWEVGTLFQSVALAFFYLSWLRFFLAYRPIGLKVVMVRKMMKNMVTFMAIMITIMFGYGIALEVTLFPEATLEQHGAKNLLRRPVWQLFGELLLDEIEGLPHCGPNMTGGDTTEDLCPSDLGRRLAPGMTAIYMFITNVLLLNLLIAIFSSTYLKVKQRAVRYLNYESYRLAMEFAVRSFFPPPLSVFENIFTLIRACLGYGGLSFEEIAQDTHSQIVEEGMEVQKTKEDQRWEKKMQDRYLEKHEDGEISSQSPLSEDTLSAGLWAKLASLKSTPRNDLRPSGSIDVLDETFRKLFLKQMSDMNEKLVKMEGLLQNHHRNPPIRRQESVEISVNGDNAVDPSSH